MPLVTSCAVSGHVATESLDGADVVGGGLIGGDGVLVSGVVEVSGDEGASGVGTAACGETVTVTGACPPDKALQPVTAVPVIAPSAIHL